MKKALECIECGEQIDFHQSIELRATKQHPMLGIAGNVVYIHPHCALKRILVKIDDLPIK